MIQKAQSLKKEVVIVSVVDLRKAFDSVPRTAILNRLIKLNCPWNMVNAIQTLFNFQFEF